CSLTEFCHSSEYGFLLSHWGWIYFREYVNHRGELKYILREFKKRCADLGIYAVQKHLKDAILCYAHHDRIEPLNNIDSILWFIAIFTSTRMEK
ncbi:MAG: hypothetical protein WCK35_19200, partial [Chloroflexota bacterium]